MNMSTPVSRKPFVRLVDNPRGRSAGGFCGTVDYYSSIPTSWQLELIGELPSEDQRDDLLALLPSWKDGQP